MPNGMPQQTFFRPLPFFPSLVDPPNQTNLIHLYSDGYWACTYNSLSVTLNANNTLPINPDLQAPPEPLLVRLDSSSNIIEQDYPRFPSRPYSEKNLESTQPDFNDEYMTHVLSTDMVNPQQNPIHSIWITPS
jgi:hypothetical protein